MQTIKILYFASLRELVGVAESNLDVLEPMDAAAVWKAVNQTVDLPESSLVAINQSYASLDTLVEPGDEVAFFPPVTGG
jgi:molybdopterin synthase sulfur carrier subunit